MKLIKRKEVIEQRADQFTDMVERLATNEAVDPDKLQKLVDLQMQIMDRNAKTAFYASMNQVQAELPTVSRDAENEHTHSRYARLETIARAIKPVYAKHGFSASFNEGTAVKENHIRVEGILRHREGHSESNYWAEVPIDKTGISGTVNKTDVHATGSTFTYGRRYLTCMMFDVATGDDTDGNVPDGPTELITKKQAADLKALIIEVGADQAAFLEYCQVDRLEDVPAFNFKFAVSALEKKREQ